MLAGLGGHGGGGVADVVEVEVVRAAAGGVDHTEVEEQPPRRATGAEQQRCLPSLPSSPSSSPVGFVEAAGDDPHAHLPIGAQRRVATREGGHGVRDLLSSYTASEPTELLSTCTSSTWLASSCAVRRGGAARGRRRGGGPYMHSLYTSYIRSCRTASGADRLWRRPPPAPRGVWEVCCFSISLIRIFSYPVEIS